MSSPQNQEGLSAEQLEVFNTDGYVILPSFIPEDYRQVLKAEIDQKMDDQANCQWKVLVPNYKELGLMTSYPPLMAKVSSLMESNYTLHHIHAVRQDPGNPGVSWHQDYEQIPQSNRSHIMIHVFFYLDGLNGEVGDLLVLPKSQNAIVNNNGINILGESDLPGSITVDNVPPGTAIIVHSALWHARRAKPGGGDHHRYFIDISYCQNGVLWPSYRHTKEQFDYALANNFGRDGQYDFLYDTSQFYDRFKAQEHLSKEGSLAVDVIKDLQL